MRIDRHHGAQPVMRGDGREHHRGFALEAANLNDRSARRHACRQHAQESRFVFAEETGRPLCELPGFFDNRIEIRWKRSHWIHSCHYIFSGAVIPSSDSARTNCASTNSVSRSRKARFCSSASDRMWCL